MANPLLDRRAQWRYIEWDPVDKVAYGIIGGNNMLFRFDVSKGKEGEITPLTLMCSPSYIDVHPYYIPHATLAMTINQKNRKIYYIPVTRGDFDYGLVSIHGEDRNKVPLPRDVKIRNSAYLVSYDLKTGEREFLGILKPTDGSYARGMEAAETDRDGRVWFVGSFEQTDEALKLNGGFRTGLGLGCYDPFSN